MYVDSVFRRSCRPPALVKPFACRCCCCCCWFGLRTSLRAHPYTLQNGGDTNYTVDVDETKLDMEDGILTNDVRGVIRPALKELKVAIMRRTSEFRQVCAITGAPSPALLPASGGVFFFFSFEAKGFLSFKVLRGCWCSP